MSVEITATFLKSRQQLEVLSENSKVISMNLKILGSYLLFVTLILFFLCLCGCLITSQPGQPQPHLTVSPGITPTASNENATAPVPRPSIICNCPMEPVVSTTVTPLSSLGDGSCHCP